MTLLTNMSLSRNVSCPSIEVVCSLVFIVSGVVSTFGSISLIVGSISILGSDPLSFGLTLLFVGDDSLGVEGGTLSFGMLAVLLLLTRWPF